MIDSFVLEYLSRAGPHKLEIGIGYSKKPGWFSTDILIQEGVEGDDVIRMDATEPFPIPSDTFDYVYSEHMIEHVSFVAGQAMLRECHRILKPGGVLRIVTPSLGFLTRIISADRSALENRYRDWAVKTFVPEAPKVTNAFFLNNFVRAWNHTFIYDRETLELAMLIAGFKSCSSCELNQSNYADLQSLEHEDRMMPGFLDLESMVIEATKDEAFSASNVNGDASPFDAEDGSTLAEPQAPS